MGANGCGSEARGDRKTRQTEAQMMVSQCMFGTLWPGKFPQKYARAGIEGVRMSVAIAAAAAAAAAK